METGSSVFYQTRAYVIWERGGGEIGEGGKIILGSWLNWGVMRLEGRLDWRVIYFLWGVVYCLGRKGDRGL